MVAQFVEDAHLGGDVCAVVVVAGFSRTRVVHGRIVEALAEIRPIEVTRATSKSSYSMPKGRPSRGR